MVFITAKVEVEDETKGFVLGAVDYITKPISPPIVLERINTHLKLQEVNKELSKANNQLDQLNQLLKQERNIIENIVLNIQRSPLFGLFLFTDTR